MNFTGQFILSIKIFYFNKIDKGTQFYLKTLSLAKY